MSSPTRYSTPTADEGLKAPIGRAALGGLVVPVVIGALFVVAAASQPAGDGDGLRSGLLGLLAGAVGATAGLGVLLAAGARPASAWPFTLLFASGTRMLGGLAIALPLYLVSSPGKLPFWGVFLAVALTAIVGEVAALGPFLRSLSSGSPSSPDHAAPPSVEARSA
ncbi:MAG: hypothetical protein AAF297_06580 [Planctomycetota bacterium]